MFKNYGFYARVLETNYAYIKCEYENSCRTEYVDWHEKNLCATGWKVFPLMMFGEAKLKNQIECPLIMDIMKAIPRATTFGFSLLLPHTKINPHIGYKDGTYRVHLGIDVPDNCGMRVGSSYYNWVNGKCFAFDDEIEHEVWNNSNKERAVFIMDVLR